MALTWTGWAEVPGGGATHVGLTAVRDVAGFNMALFAAGEDNHIYVNSSPDDENWSGWTEVPGEGRTAVALSAASQGQGQGQGQKLYLYAAGTDEHIYVTSTADGTNWNGWNEVSGGGRTQVALYAVPGVGLFAAGTDERIYINPSPITGEWAEVPGGGLTNAGLCGNEFNISGGGSFFDLFAKGIDDHIYQNVISGPVPGVGKWVDVPSGGPPTGPSPTPVALTAAPTPGTGLTQAHLFATGTDRGIYFNEWFETWSGWNPVPGGGLTDAALAAVTFNATGSDGSGTLFLFAKGTDDRIYWNRGNAM